MRCAKTAYNYWFLSRTNNYNYTFQELLEKPASTPSLDSSNLHSSLSCMANIFIIKFSFFYSNFYIFIAIYTLKTKKNNPIVAS